MNKESHIEAGASATLRLLPEFSLVDFRAVSGRQRRNTEPDGRSVEHPCIHCDQPTIDLAEVCPKCWATR